MSSLSVVDAVVRDLAHLARRAPGIDESAEAALAVKLAEEVESTNSLHSRVTAANALAGLLAELKASAPAEETSDRLDDLAKQRQKRRAS